MDWGADLNTKEKVSQATLFIVICFLTLDVVSPHALCSCYYAFPTVISCIPSNYEPKLTFPFLIVFMDINKNAPFEIVEYLRIYR